MNSQDIRNRWHPNAVEQEWMPMTQVEVMQELAAQLAELNEARKPRWVNLSDGEPCLVDATRVVGLSSGIHDGNRCVTVRLRDTPNPFIVFGMDHDEVRGKLGINEDWVQSPKASNCVQITHSHHAELMAIIDAAREVIRDRALIETSTGNARENLDKLDRLFDDFDLIPF